MDIYDNINKNQDGLQLANIICSMFHLQDDDKKDLMSGVEMDKQVYFL